MSLEVDVGESWELNYPSGDLDSGTAAQGGL